MRDPEDGHRRRQNSPRQTEAPTFEPVNRSDDDDLEHLLGSTWLSRIGIAILVLGFAFFIKHAIDQGWIGPAGQIGLAVAAGLILVGVGDWLNTRGRYGFYPQVLAGGGGAILYFAAFAAYAFEPYRQAFGTPVELSLLLLCTTALLLGLYAVGRVMPVVAGQAAVLTMITGFLPGPEVAVLRVSQTVLLAGVLAMAALVRRWASVVAVVQGATYVTFFSFLLRGLDPGAVLLGLLGVLPFFLATGFRKPREGEPDEVLIANAAVTLGATWGLGLIAIARLAGPEADLSALGGWLTLGAAAIGLSLAALPAPERSRLGWGAIGAIAAVGWPMIQFDGAPTAGLWFAFLAGAALVQRFSPSGVARSAMWLLAGLGFVHLAFDELPALHSGELAVGWAALVVTLGVLTLSLVWWVEREAIGELAAGLTFALPATVLYAIFAILAVPGFWSTVIWAAQGLVLVVAGFALAARDLRYLGLGMFMMVVLKVLFVDMAGLDMIWKILAFMAVGTILLVASFLYSRFLGKGERPVEAAGGEGV